MKRPYFVMALALVACGGNVGSVVDTNRSGEPTTTPPVASPEPAPAATPIDTCNGLDDDGDGKADVGELAGPCSAACTSEAIASKVRELRLPRAEDVTVASDSGETPELTQMTSLPTFCTQAPAGVVRVGDDIEVGCSAVFEIGEEGLRGRSLRIAPGGIVRVKANASIQLSDTLLVCPGATVQAGADSLRAPPTDPHVLDGHRLAITSRVLVVLGAIEARGGTVIGDERAGAGNGGELEVDVERLLLAGSIDNSGGGQFNHGQSAGGFSIIATKESFFSGTIRSSGGNGGTGYVKVPVCCHGP